MQAPTESQTPVLHTWLASDHNPSWLCNSLKKFRHKRSYFICIFKVWPKSSIKSSLLVIIHVLDLTNHSLLHGAFHYNVWLGNSQEDRNKLLFWTRDSNLQSLCTDPMVTCCALLFLYLKESQGRVYVIWHQHHSWPNAVLLLIPFLSLNSDFILGKQWDWL